jgi:endonuclease III-like uncharacterized protein
MFAILVAGKGAEQQAKKLDAFLKNAKTLGLPSDTTPFEFLEYITKGFWLWNIMKLHKLGQYKRLEGAFKGILAFKDRLKNVTIEELELVKGIGSKTANFFLLHSRKDYDSSCLDTHILKFLNENGVKAPKATPSNKKKYKELSEEFKKLAKIHYPSLTLAEADLTIWKVYSQKIT